MTEILKLAWRGDRLKTCQAALPSHEGRGDEIEEYITKVVQEAEQRGGLEMT